MKTGSQLTIEAMLAAAADLADQEYYLGLKIAQTRKELTELESQLVGIRERKRVAKEIISLAEAASVKREVSIREQRLLQAAGIEANAGDEFTAHHQHVLNQLGRGEIETPAMKLAKELS